MSGGLPDRRMPFVTELIGLYNEKNSIKDRRGKRTMVHVLLL